MIKKILGLVGLVILSSLVFGCLQQHQSFAQTANMPDQPVGVTATAISPTSINLNWNPPQNNGGFPITKYEIDYRVVPNTSYIVLATIDNVTTYTHTNLITGKTYIYRVSAINTIGTGNPSAEVLATPTTTRSITPPSGNTSGITITTDKTSYKDGDTVTISGTVSNYVSNTLVNVRLLSPIGNIVLVDQVDVGSDRTFLTTITATGALWQIPGTYTVKAQYGSPDFVTSTFQFSGSAVTGMGNNIKVDGTDISVKYSMTNGQVLGMRFDSQPKSVIVSIQAIEDGVLTVTLPRALISPTLPNGQDGMYRVLVDNQQENNFQETGTTTIDRTLSIPFTAGTGQIAIMDTQNNSVNSTSSNPASTITVTTDKASYSNGNAITISGTVSGYISNVPISIRINDPRGNIIELTQVNVGSDRTFSTTITNTAGTTWQQVGTYSVTAIYGNPNIVAQTTFQFSGSSNSQPGNTGTITVTTDKLVYDHNSLIIIKGHVANVIVGQEVNMKITSPSDNVIVAGQVSTGNNGNFSAHISTVGNLWFENGQYTLAVQQGENQTRFNSTVFQISGVGPVIASPVQQVTTPMTPVISPTQQDIENINQARNNQTIAAEVNIGNNKTETTSIDNNVTVKPTSTTPDSLGVTVNASSQTGPKVIVFNINATTINVSNLKELGVTYDGKPISPAPNMDAILHAKSTDNPSFAIVVTQSGVQVLVLVPHFSEHTITITNMSKVIPSVPEFGPVVGIVVVVSIIGSTIISKRVTIQ